MKPTEPKSECTYTGCEETATRIAAIRSPIGRPTVYVCPYCETHAQDVVATGGYFAAGPALADDLRSIEGVR